MQQNKNDTNKDEVYVLSGGYSRVYQIIEEDPSFDDLSSDEMLLYRDILPLVPLSIKNGHRNKDGETVVYMSNEKALKKIHKKSHDSATKCFRNLEVHNLIKITKRGLGKCKEIVVFIPFREGEKVVFMKAEKSFCKTLNNRSMECERAAANNKYNNSKNTNISHYNNGSKKEMRTSHNNTTGRKGSFEVADFFEAALRRSYGNNFILDRDDDGSESSERGVE